MTVTRFKGMGTTIEVHAADAHDVVEATIMFEEFEQRFSRFRPDSELSDINASGGRPIEVSEEMADLLSAAVVLRERTGGLVDVGVGTAVRAWGYDDTFSRIQGLARRPEASVSPSWTIDDGVVRLGPGTKLDLGGLAKGWSCDRVIESGIGTMVSAGGDLRSVDPSLVVEVLDHRDEVAVEVAVGVGAYATSSRAKRTWLVDGHRAHHLIDPRTMAPASTPVLSASVLAATAVEAEAGAKAVLLRGSDGLAWADTQPWIRHALVVWHDGNVYGTSLRRAS
jgi:thiamine biosynthesis lipoprotein